MPGPLDSVIKEKVLERLAGERAYQRGCELHQHAHVQPSDFTADLAAADVLDGSTRSVTLTSEAGELDPACPCPSAEGGLLCEHGVATALAWLQWRKSGKKPKTVRKKKLTTEESLALLPQERLVRMILDVAAAHPLANAAFQRSLALHSTQGIDTVALRKTILAQLTASGKTAFRDVIELDRRLEQVERDIRQVLAAGNAYAALDLCEAALTRLVKIARSMDRHWGDVIRLQTHFEHFHAELAEAAHPAPAELAKRIAAIIEAGLPALAFSEVGQTHGATLGAEGLRALQALLPASLMTIDLRISICSSLGDTALVRSAIEALPNPRAAHYIALANLHARQGNLAAAVQACEDGLAKARWEQDPLRHAMLPWVAKLSGGSASANLAFAWFCKDPSKAAYRRLRQCATNAGNWPEWYARMFQALQEDRVISRQTAISILHTALLDDGNAKAALQFYRDHPEGEADRLLEIAALLDPSDPRLATDLRFEHAQEKIRLGLYFDAVNALRAAAPLAAAHNQAVYFDQGLRRFLAANARKSSFMRLLHQYGGGLGLDK